MEYIQSIADLVNIHHFFPPQYLGFGIGGQSAGRRAASQADVAHQTAVTDVEEDNQEKDALLSKVEARDMIEFGMIPVSYAPSFIICFIWSREKYLLFK